MERSMSLGDATALSLGKAEVGSSILPYGTTPGRMTP